MTGNGDELRQRILKLIDQHPEGLSIQDIADRLESHRHTVSKHLSYLEGAGEITVRRIGNVSLIYRRPSR